MRNDHRYSAPMTSDEESRPPTVAETARALAFVRRIEGLLAEEKIAPAERRLRAWQSLCRVILAANEFIYVE